ncbi:hypothetical protein BGZ58_005110, partial [Dissophora ornata]
MFSKFGSTYFRTVQKGPPQQRAFARADLNDDDFVVAHNNASRKGKIYCEFASYQYLSTFLQVYSSIPDEERCFNEIIREGRECAEYYDIDWKQLDKDDKPELCTGQRLAELEQQVFASFLEVRNQFAPYYPVLEEQCRVLSASSGSKVSLHITIPQYVFENNHEHMKA